jgi:glycerol kinase
MSELLLSIDQGTTGTTALLLSRTGIVASHNVEFKNYFPAPGRVEHEAAEIWGSVAAAVGRVLQGIDPSRLAAIGITNQRETSLFWDEKTGAPVHRALVWQDRRTASRCDALKAQGQEEFFKARTGLVLDPYFSGTKAEWVLNNVSGTKEAASTGKIRFGTIDSYLAWKLTGEHVTDASNASRTLLYNLHTGGWDEELCAVFGVPSACLPKIVDNAGVVGHTRNVGFLPDGIPVAGLAGDQQSALFGQACFSTGMAKCTYGTGAFLLLNTGNKPVRSKHGLLTTVGWRLNGRTTFALEGSVFIAGAVVQWLRDGLGFFQSSSEIEALAASVPDSGGVIFVPALTGLGAPHWRADATGTITGITRGTTRAHIARAALEGIALQVVDIMRAMEGDSGAPLAELRVDGGAARNNLLMQYQADMLGLKCVRPENLETTAFGAAFLAGLGVGFFESLSDVAWKKDREFMPEVDAELRAGILGKWGEAVGKA